MPINKKKCPIVIFSHVFNETNADFAMNSEYLGGNGVGAYCLDFYGGSVNSKSDLKTTEMSIFTEKEDLNQFHNSEPLSLNRFKRQKRIPHKKCRI